MIRYPLRTPGIVSFAAAACMWPGAIAPAQDHLVTRAHLADRYIAVERAYRENELSEFMQRLAHRMFDAAAAPFFVGNLPEAARRMVELEWLIERGMMPTSDEFALLSIAVNAEPPVWIIDQESKPERTLRFSTLFPVGSDAPVAIPVRIELVDSTDAVSCALDVDLQLTPDRRFDPPTVSLPEASELAPGTYRITLSNPPGNPRHVGRVIVSEASLDAQREQFLAQLNALHFDDADLEAARRTCIERANLLRDRASPTQSAQFRLDPIAHVASLKQELAAFENGVNPYQHRPGHLWRTFHVRGQSVPMRIDAPAVGDPYAPRPLVIALHGAGGDENLFPDGYGAGLIADLADAHGFIVASPLTYAFAGDITVFDHLLDRINRDYVVDPDRIYLVGHSLGAATATMIANLRSDRIAAVGCIAGAGRFMSDGQHAYPPTLVIAPELDTIVPAARLERLSNEGEQSGLPIEFRLVPDTAHLLIVSDVLEEVIEWLLQHRNETE